MLQLHLAVSDNIRVVHGVTDGTGDTALATLPPNPFPGNQNVLAIPVGGKGGVYVNDDGTVAPRQLGVTTTTIDVRSTEASEFFVLLVIALGPGETVTRDHSSVTT